jgi:hypothetical protein
MFSELFSLPFAFKSKEKSAEAKTVYPMRRVKDAAKIVAEIHNEFDTAAERLLKEAKAIIGNTDKANAEKASRLKKLGFGSAAPVKKNEGQVEKERKGKELADLILYYQTWYPGNKFITEQEVERICKKYGLLCGAVSNYIGDVPEKNLREIEAFKLRDEEMLPGYDYDYSMPLQTIGIQNRFEQDTRRMGLGDWMRDEQLRQREQFLRMQQEFVSRLYSTPSPVKATVKGKRKPEFKICAPVKDFDTTMMRVSDGYKLESIPDPIVLQPVKGGYLVVSKWGLEAGDEGLVNEKSP